MLNHSLCLEDGPPTEVDMASTIRDIREPDTIRSAERLVPDTMPITWTSFILHLQDLGREFKCCAEILRLQSITPMPNLMESVCARLFVMEGVVDSHIKLYLQIYWTHGAVKFA